MIRFVEISKSSHQSFAENLYTLAFDADERRDFSQIPLIYNKINNHFYIIEKEQQPIAILALWDLNQFLYIEHLAVSEQARNQGIGSSIIENLKNMYSKPIVLEVEQPFEPLQQRRIRFYERLGFVLLPNNYIQPPYSPDKQSLQMRIMLSDENLLRFCPFETIQARLHTSVYYL
ncbi:MAG: GNAT family N-acetyltransferase [Bacteroidales bacterium]|nr:GNAT family N-acetyltransferase [Bacteroidales bacterium]